MHRYIVISLCLITTISGLAGCYPNRNSRYYLQTQQMPNGTVTSVMDAKHKTQVLYITELSLNPPAITVLPLSRLDVSSVSVGPIGQDEVLIGYNEKDEGNEHSIAVSEHSRPMASVLGNTDIDKDGKADKRILRFGTETGFIQYFDFDANGILDAQYSMALEGESAREARILVDQCWVAIEGDSAPYYDPAPKVTSREEPKTNYQFQDGTWRKTEIPATPQ
jgi:hypothetical protein